MRAVWYLRAVPGLSFEAQQRACLDACAQAKLEVGPVFTETAAPPAAPEFRRMVRTLLGGEGAAGAATPEQQQAQRDFSAVLVASLEVFGPTVREQARRYLQLEALGLPLRVANAADPDAALIEAWPNRTSSEQRRERVRDGMRDRALRGEVLGRAPYGYHVSMRHLRVDPDEAAIVRGIFVRYLDRGEGVRVIARALNERGVRTRRGGQWSMVSVREVLRNPVYTGTYRRLGVVVPNAHDALVTRERFGQAQQLLSARRTSFARQVRAEYLLAGLATCAYCGAHLIGARRRSRARVEPSTTSEERAAPRMLTYYMCETDGCPARTHRADTIEAAVRAALADPAHSAPGTHAQAAQPEPSDDSARIEARRDGLRRRLDTLLERRIRGEWTAARLRAEAAHLALEDLQAEEESDVLSRRRAVAADTRRRAAHLEASRARLVNHWDTLPPAEHRLLLREVVTLVTVWNDETQVTLTS